MSSPKMASSSERVEERVAVVAERDGNEDCGEVGDAIVVDAPGGVRGDER